MRREFIIINHGFVKVSEGSSQSLVSIDSGFGIELMSGGMRVTPMSRLNVADTNGSGAPKRAYQHYEAG